MDKITAEIFQQNPERYTLIDGSTHGAPSCKYGNTQDWVGYDKVEKTFIRFTKSVYKRLINEIEFGEDKHKATL
ncbi:MAG: hypothetical protein ABIN24_00740 [Dyadobacter sp.]